MAMTPAEASHIIAALRSQGAVRFFNAGYGRWGFEHRAEDDRFRYYSEFWAMDLHNPEVEEQLLDEDGLRAMLEKTYRYRQLAEAMGLSVG